MDIENLPTLEEDTKSDVDLKENPEDFKVGDIVLFQGKKRKVLALNPLETSTDLEYKPEKTKECDNKELRDKHFFMMINVVSLEKLSKEQLISIARLLEVEHKEDMKNNELIEIINGARPV